MVVRLYWRASQSVINGPKQVERGRPVESGIGRSQCGRRIIAGGDRDYLRISTEPICSKRDNSNASPNWPVPPSNNNRIGHAILLASPRWALAQQHSRQLGY